MFLLKTFYDSDTARNSAVYFVASLVILVIGEVFYMTTLLWSSKNLFAFFSGVSFVVGGTFIDV